MMFRLILIILLISFLYLAFFQENEKIKMKVEEVLTLIQKHFKERLLSFLKKIKETLQERLISKIHSLLKSKIETQLENQKKKLQEIGIKEGERIKGKLTDNLTEITNRIKENFISLFQEFNIKK